MTEPFYSYGSTSRCTDPWVYHSWIVRSFDCSTGAVCFSCCITKDASRLFYLFDWCFTRYDTQYYFTFTRVGQYLVGGNWALLDGKPMTIWTLQGNFPTHESRERKNPSLNTLYFRVNPDLPTFQPFPTHYIVGLRPKLNTTVSGKKTNSLNCHTTCGNVAPG